MKTGFINGNIYINLKKPEKCEAIVIDNKKIIYTGSNNDAIKISDKIIDLKGKTVLPGLIDAHMHLDELGMYLNILDLRNVKSIEEIRKRLEEFSKTHDGPIMGHGWDQELFIEKRYPNKKDIDDIVNDRPVILTRVCLHAALVNSYFLEIMNFKSENGLLFEKDFELFRSKFNSLVPRDLKKNYIYDALKFSTKFGLTSLGFVSCSSEIFSLLKELNNENKIPIRIFVYANADDFEKIIGFKDTEYLKLKGVKLFVDGSLGARTALLSNKYYDSDTFGEKVFEENYLKRHIEMATKNNYQVAIHAIGDAAIDIVLKLLKNYPGNRVEHCSVVRDDQLEKLNGLNLVVQPHFILTDFWILERLGQERAKFAYRFKDFLKISNVACSTDSPVEPLNPYETIYAAVTRGKNENIPLYDFTKDQTFTILEAFYSYTRGSALALNENNIGELLPGNYADFIIFDEDPINMDANKIREIMPNMVYVSGKMIYQKSF